MSETILKKVTEEEALERVRTLVATFEFQGDAAASWDVSRAYISDILNKRKGIPGWLLEKVGLSRELIEETVTVSPSPRKRR